jgi:hypothetical protein
MKELEKETQYLLQLKPVKKTGAELELPIVRFCKAKS